MKLLLLSVLSIGWVVGSLILTTEDTLANTQGEVDAGEINEKTTSLPDIIAGEKLYKKTCKNCHGPTAAGMASFPKLKDKDAGYLIGRLNQYRAGEQLGPNTPLMRPHAEKLSDSDISNVAEYISALGK